MNWLGTANRKWRTPSDTLAASVLTSRSSDRGRPDAYQEFSRVVRISFMTAGSRTQSRVSWPFFASRSARVVPQLPPPITAIFMPSSSPPMVRARIAAGAAAQGVVPTMVASSTQSR